MELWDDYSTKNNYRVDADKYYGDVLIKDINNDYIFNVVRYKFSDVFLGKTSSEYNKEEHFNCLKENDDVSNAIIHYIINIDRDNGLTFEKLKKDYYLKKINDGLFGEYIKENFKFIPDKTQSAILHFIFLKEKTNNRHDYFESAVKDIFSNVVLYYDTFEKKMYIFTTDEATDENKIAYTLCEEIFKTIFLQTEIKWNYKPIIFELNNYQISENTDYFNIV